MIRRAMRRFTSGFTLYLSLGWTALRRGWWRAGLFLIVLSPALAALRLLRSTREPVNDDASPFVYVLQ